MNELTESQLHILRHALGLNYKKKSYRNHYCCEAAAPELLGLVELGLMTGPHTHAMLGEGMAYFYVTAAGKAKALGPDEGYGEPGMCKHYIPDAKERCAICYPEIRGMQAHSPDEGEGSKP